MASDVASEEAAAATETFMFKVSNLTKHYPTPRGPLTVLSDVTFSLAPGEAAAITGPSGSGKSSLLYMLGGLEPPTSGTITLGGRNLFALTRSELAEFRNAKIGFVFQDHCLLPQCSVLENVLIPTLVAPAASDEDRRPTRARTLIDQVGLADRVDHRPAELSGGEKQRVAIARALIRQPRSRAVRRTDRQSRPESRQSRSRALLLDLHRQHQNILIIVTHSVRLASQFPIRFELDECAIESS